MPKLVTIAQHEIEGTLRPNRHGNKFRPQQGSIGRVPDWFGPIATEEWSRITRDPQYKRILAPSFRPAFLEYCVLFERMVLDAKGERTMRATERTLLHSLMAHLGMTPVDAAKIPAPAETKPDDPWAKI